MPAASQRTRKGRCRFLFAILGGTERSVVDLYLFDFDRTLYAYDFRMRLPALALITGASQYHLARTWWAGGYEHRAEMGEWNTAGEYLSEFRKVTGADLSLENWREARALASTSIPASIEALRLASTLGTVAVFSNNPSPFAESLPLLAPDVTAIVGDNRLVSCDLGVRKPDPDAYLLAMKRFGAKPANTFFADDSPANVAGAEAVGITAYLLPYVGQAPQADGMSDAVMAFAGRKR
ncbi:MAG: family phosphatase [Microbacteriaceae bacterium]|nr:family phosphatase [Microbacteriaceae bacterium]